MFPKDIPTSPQCIAQGQTPKRRQAMVINSLKIMPNAKASSKCERVINLRYKIHDPIVIIQQFAIFKTLTLAMDYLEQYQPSWNCLLDMFDQMVNADESQITQELLSHNETCDDQSGAYDANESERVDAFGEPKYNIEVKPNLSFSIAKTTERLTQLFRAQMTEKEKKKTSVEKIEIQITESEKDSCSSSQDSFEDQKRKYILKKEKKVRKENKAKKEPYPTKNFLPSFRTSFLNYLEKHFTKDQFYSFQIIRKIKGKPCINLKDYQNLFKQKEFRPILKVYFENGVIVRDLMASRIDYDIKMEYMARIHVFQEAYKSGVFNKIN